MDEKRVLGMLSLCRRAGRLTAGMEAVLEAAGKGAAFLVLLAEDLLQVLHNKPNLQVKNIMLLELLEHTPLIIPLFKQ